MKFLSFAVITACLLSACGEGTPNTNTGDSITSPSVSATPGTDSNWVSLFDGKTFKGWHTYGDSTVGSAWNIDSGAIHMQPGAKNGYQTKGGGDIITDSAYGNFDFSVEWKVGDKANSGIMFYVQDDKKKYPETWYTGPESQVLDIDSNEDAHSPLHQVADLYDLIAGKSHPGNKWGQWNRTEIISNNGQLDIILNGVNIISTTLWDDSWKKLIAKSKFKDMPSFGMFKMGHFALQDHGEAVWYRNIRVKRL